MNHRKNRYSKKQICPCSRNKKTFTALLDEFGRPSGGGKCWSTACGQRFFPPPRPAGSVSSNTDTTEVRREHVYHTQAGDPYMRITVVKRLDGEKTAFVDHWDGIQWQKGANGIDRILYKLPQVIERVAQGGTICICEGEKDCDNAESIGITATCNPFGAEKWKDEMSHLLVGARVTIIPDLDEPGRKHAEQVERSLREAGVAAVGILDLRTLMPDLPEKGDLSDYLDRRGDPHALRLAIETSSKDIDEVEEQAPRLPTINWSGLPEPLAQITGPVSNELHRIALLTACMVTAGSIMPNVTTKYFGKQYSPGLYFFLCGPPGAGKSIIEPAMYLVEEIEREIYLETTRKLDEYKRKMSAYNRSKGKTNDPAPKEPDRKMLLIPADSTAPVIVRAICNNRSVLLFDTEADSLQNALRTETGDASPALRKAWHGERVAQARVGDNLLVSTDNPSVAMVLSGTPDQILVLIKHVDSGLASRFRFMMLKPERKFSDPFTEDYEKVHDISREHRMHMRDLWAFIKSSVPENSFTVVLNGAQQRQIVENLKPLYEDPIEDADAGTTLRSGIVIVRFATILTVLRNWYAEGTLECRMTVTDEDFTTALVVSEFLRQHTDAVIKSLKQHSSKQVLRPATNKNRKWLDALPTSFTTKEAIEIGKANNLSRASVFEMLKHEGRFRKDGHGLYSKIIPTLHKGP